MDPAHTAAGRAGLHRLRSRLQMVLYRFREHGLLPESEELGRLLRKARKVLFHYRRRILPLSVRPLAYTLCQGYTERFLFTGKRADIRQALDFCSRLMKVLPRTRNGRAKYRMATAEVLVRAFEQTEGHRHLRVAVDLCMDAFRESRASCGRIQNLLTTGRVLLRFFETFGDESFLDGSGASLQLALEYLTERGFNGGHIRAECESLYGEALRRLFQLDGTDGPLDEAYNVVVHCCVSVPVNSPYLPYRIVLLASIASTRIRTNEDIGIALTLLDDASSYIRDAIPTLDVRNLDLRISAVRASLLLSRFCFEGNPVDADDAIALYVGVINALLPGSPNHVRTSCQLAQAHRTVARVSLDVHHFDEAITILMQLNQLVPTLSVWLRGLVARELSKAFIERGDHSGNIVDLILGAVCSDRCVGMYPDSMDLMVAALGQAALARHTKAPRDLIASLRLLHTARDTLHGDPSEEGLYKIVSGQIYDVHAIYEGRVSTWKLALANLETAALYFEEDSPWHSEAILRAGICHIQLSDAQDGIKSVAGGIQAAWSAFEDIQAAVNALRLCVRMPGNVFSEYGAEALTLANDRLEEFRERMLYVA